MKDGQGDGVPNIDRHALVITAGRIDPDGPVAGDRTSPLGLLDFVDSRARRLERILTRSPFGYRVTHVSEPDRSRLRSVGELLEDTDGACIIHVVGHGEVVEQALHLVPSSGHFGGTTNLKQLCENAQLTRRQHGDQHVLLVLDLCHAGAALDTLTHGQVDELWVAAACGADSQTARGWFSQAFTDVIDSIAAEDFDTAAAVEFVAMRDIEDAVSRRFHALWTDAGVSPAPECEFAGLFRKGSIHNAPFFRNPRFSALAQRQAASRADITTALHQYLDAPHFQDRAGRHFTGRREILTELGGWRSARDGADGLRIVTGSAGSGKSSIAAAMVLTCHPQIIGHPDYREDCEHLLGLLPETCREPVPVPVAAVHARQLRMDQIVESLVEQLAAQHPQSPPGDEAREKPDRFVAWLRSVPVPPLLIVDALDEAIDPSGVVQVLLGPMLSAKRGDGRAAARLLVAGRNTDPDQQRQLDVLVELSSGYRVHDLNQVDPRVVEVEIRDFLTAVLTDDTERTWSAELIPAIAAPTGAILAHRGDVGEYGAFLVAALYVRYLARRRLEPSDLSTVLSSIPRSLPDVLEMDLAQGAAAGQADRRALLAALAHAKGDGMPATVAECVARDVFGAGSEFNAVTSLRDSHDVKVYLRGGSEESGTPLYRLFHKGLSDYLMAHPSRPRGEGRTTATDEHHHGGVATALGRYAVKGGWNNAEPYLKRHLAEHAVDAGQLGGLLSQPDFLPNADPRHLLPLLRESMPGELGHLIAAAYRAGADLHRSTNDTGQRAARLTLDQLRAGISPAQTRDLGSWWPRWVSDLTVDPALLDVLSGPGEVASAIACSTLDNRQVAVTGGTDGAKVWDLASGEVIRELTGCGDQVTAIACTTLNGRPVAVSGDKFGGVSLLDLTTGETLHNLPGHTGTITAIGCTTVDGQAIAIVGDSSSSAVVWDLTTARFSHRLNIGNSGITAIGSMGDNRVAIAHRKSGVSVWNLSTGLRLGSIFESFNVAGKAVAITAIDGKPVAVMVKGSNMVDAYNLKTGQHVCTLNGLSGFVTSVACTVIEQQPVAISGGHLSGIRLWNLTSLQLPGDRSGTRTPVTSVIGASVDDVPVFILYHSYRGIQIVSSEDGQHFRTLPHDRGRDIQLSRTSGGHPIVVCRNGQGGMSAWDVATGEPLSQITSQVGSVTASTCTVIDGQPMVVTVSNTGEDFNQLRVCATDTGELVNDFPIRSSRIRTIDCSTINGQPVAIVGDDDGRVRILSLRTGRTLRDIGDDTYPAILAIICTTFHGTPAAVIGRADPEVEIWDMSTGRRINSLPGHIGIVTAIASGKIGDRPIIATGDNSSIRIWDPLIPEPVQVIELPTLVFSLSFGPSNELIAGTDLGAFVFDPPSR